MDFRQLQTKIINMLFFPSSLAAWFWMLWECSEGKRKHLYKWMSRFGRRQRKRMFYGYVSDTGMHFHAVSIIPLWCGRSVIVVLLWHHHRNITESLQSVFVGGPIKGYFPLNSVGRSQDKGWGHLSESGPERFTGNAFCCTTFPCKQATFLTLIYKVPEKSAKGVDSD